MAEAFIALGGNLGDVRDSFVYAREQLNRLGVVTKSSRLYNTPAVGGPVGQPNHLNAVVSLTTEIDAETLLIELLKIEMAKGRERAERWGPRTLDLDILAYGNLMVDSPTLTVPHPLLHQRAFVLIPLADIASNWLHPTLQQTPIDMIAKLDSYDVEAIRVAAAAW